MPTIFRIALVQAAPVFLDLDATIEKACDLIEEAAKGGASLVAFPEAFVPGYPLWVWFIPSGKTHPLRDLYTRLHAGSVTIPGPAVSRLAEAAADCDITVAMGVNERNSEGSDSTLFNTILYLGPDGRVLGSHRKLVPTAGERLVWGQAPGSDLEVFELPFGRVSGLLCWENYMPLARAALYGKGVELYLAPTADARDGWQATLRHIALEGRCFVLGCNQYVRRSDYPDDMELAHELEKWPEVLCRGGSAIYGPLGDLLAGPLWDESGIITADLDMGELVRARFDFDVTGHYARPDVFRLIVDESPRHTVEYEETE